MSAEEKTQLLELLETREKTISCNKILSLYPDSGPLSRDRYPKHLEFFAAGAKYRERAFVAGNRTGKSTAGAYETALHLTGDYPSWWTGRRFEHPISAWVAGDSGKTVRDVLQQKLLGQAGQFGTGMLPRDRLLKWSSKPGVPDAIESVQIKHVSGGVSELAFKSYFEGQETFQGTERHLIWLDEECSLAIYAESLMRTMTCDGMVMLSFTPLQGLSDVVLQFLPGGKLAGQPSETKYVVMASWDDAPHLDEDAKKELWNSIPPYQRDARSKGIPQLGSGAIYPVPESEVMIAPFEIPPHWPRGFGLDTDQGAGYTACVWGALNRETQTLFIYDCYKRSRAELAIHVDAVKSRGSWIPGVGDAAALIVTPFDAQQIISLYRQAGLNICLPDKSVEAGIEKVWQMLSGGKLKVFSSCQAWFEEFRLYRRDDRGRIVKLNDHLLDATRYLCMSGLSRMRTKPAPKGPPEPQHWGVWS